MGGNTLWQVHGVYDDSPFQNPEETQQIVT